VGWGVINPFNGLPTWSHFDQKPESESIPSRMILTLARLRKTFNAWEELEEHCRAEENSRKRPPFMGRNGLKLARGRRKRRQKPQQKRRSGLQLTFTWDTCTAEGCFKKKKFVSERKRKNRPAIKVEECQLRDTRCRGEPSAPPKPHTPPKNTPPPQPSASGRGKPPPGKPPSNKTLKTSESSLKG